MSNRSFASFFRKLEPFRFPLLFLTTFLLLYSFNLAFIGCTTKGGYYVPFIDDHLNYIKLWSSFTIRTTSAILRLFGYEVFGSKTQLQVHNHGGFTLANSCLGYGIMSLFAAFVVSYPRASKPKAKFLITGLVLIQALNLFRFVALALFWKVGEFPLIDHHLLFTFSIYLLLAVKIYLWINKPFDNKTKQSHAQHTTS